MSSSEICRRSLRRRWLLLMPAVFITYSLAYVDRVNFGFGAAAGLAETLGITGQQSALLAALFFLGYFVFQIPGAALVQRAGARWMIAAALVAWGSLAALTGIVHSFGLLALVRFALGAAESFILPGMLILLSRWFTKQERSRANTFLILGNPVTVLWMSAATGYIIGAVGWQKTFIIEGLPSVVWGFIWLLLVRDRPEQAVWMHTEVCGDLRQRLASEQIHLPRFQSVARALGDPVAILLAAQYFCWSVGIYGFVLWLPTIVQRGTARGIGTTGLLSAVPYFAATLLMIVVSFFSDRSGRRRQFVWPPLFLAGAAFLGSYLSASHSFMLAYIFLIVAGGAGYAPYGPFFAIMPERFPANVAGEVTALVNSCGALGSFVGTYLVGWLEATTGTSRASFLFMSVALSASSLIILLLPRPVRAENPA